MVTTTVVCNDVHTDALIDTGAAITAVSEEFASRFPSLLCKWDGKTDGMQVPSHRGLRVKTRLQNREINGTALVMRLPAIPLIIGNDLLKQFGKLTIEYNKQENDSKAASIERNTEGVLWVTLLEDIIIPTQSVITIQM